MIDYLSQLEEQSRNPQAQQRLRHEADFIARTLSLGPADLARECSRLGVPVLLDASPEMLRAALFDHLRANGA